ncbi:hypothetical protein L596_000696 [Steinernema carpocapsae]|uniref:Uncharacterized protein n=1 Tax=Steinernema carpocapsae TaxID=34508 RepID=A0A4V6I767_STECR|nr:hypothetical protein L596_000696 [Steinernema carpocapsae]
MLFDTSLHPKTTVFSIPLKAIHREKNLGKQEQGGAQEFAPFLKHQSVPPVKNPHLLSSLNLPPTEHTNNKKFESAIFVDPAKANAKVAARPKMSNKSKKDAWEVCSTQASVKDEELMNRLTGREDDSSRSQGLLDLV